MIAVVRELPLVSKNRSQKALALSLGKCEFINGVSKSVAMSLKQHGRTLKPGMVREPTFLITRQTASAVADVRIRCIQRRRVGRLHF